MITALLRLRFRALFSSLMVKNKKNGKKAGKGMIALFAFLYLYVVVVLCGAMGFLFYSLAEPYHAMHLDWLYFAIAGLMGFGFSVIGSVFTTQNQLYDAKDNDLLLSLPLNPSAILFSRMIPLLVLNLLYASIVIGPALVVYAIFIHFSLVNLLLQLLNILAIVLLAQAVACLLGWLLHLLLSRVNKSFASVLFMVVFLGVYLGIYSQAGTILNAMALNGDAIADTFQSWVWPLYAMGQGSIGSFLHLGVFFLICLGIFVLVYRLLSITFLHSTTIRKGSRRRKLNLSDTGTRSPVSAIVSKELRHFLASPVYLTNMGIGILFAAVLTVAGVVMKDKLAGELGVFYSVLQPYMSLIICALLSYIISMMSISAPSISLEGKNLWILKTLPIAPKEILLAKLKFHCLLSVPVTVLSGLILGIRYDCNLFNVLLSALVPGLLCFLSGLFGLICNLKWPRFDWINEAYPCKQAVPVAIVMFSMMGVPILFGLLYFALMNYISPTAFLACVALLLAGICLLLYKLLTTWGAKRWYTL